MISNYVNLFYNISCGFGHVLEIYNPCSKKLHMRTKITNLIARTNNKRNKRYTLKTTKIQITIIRTVYILQTHMEFASNSNN